MLFESCCQLVTYLFQQTTLISTNNNTILCLELNLLTTYFQFISKCYYNSKLYIVNIYIYVNNSTINYYVYLKSQNHYYFIIVIFFYYYLLL
jgi:hypothetical protein